MADKDLPVPVSVQRRLSRVLKHLADHRKSACGGPLSSEACQSGGSADIEDLSTTMRATSSDHLDEKTDMLFDAKRFQGTQKPLLEAEMLPAEVYNSRKWYHRELERAFLPSWTLVGRQDEIAEAGKYLSIDTEWGGPVAVVRGNDGQLHAFANVCAHRGAKILTDGKGQAPRGGLICPYHAWTYDYSGQLMVAPGMNKTVGFDEDDIRLTPVRLELFHGFIFVCASKEAKSLKECLGDLPEKLPQWFGPEGATQNMVCAARRTYEVPCNWKFIFENTCETYHTSVVHRASLGPMKSTPMEPHEGDWDGVRVPTERTIVPLPEDFEGDNFPLPTFTNKSCFVNIYPSLQINVTWDCLWWMNTIPTSESSSRIEMGFCFPAPTTKLDVFPSRLERYLHRWHTAVTEDNDISMNQQRGVRSLFRKPGRYCQLEFGTHNFNNWLLSKVLDDQVSAWQPGQRVFKSTEELWSNDDAQMLRLVDEASETASRGSSSKGPMLVSRPTNGGEQQSG